MFIVTNREVYDDNKRKGIERFGIKLNPKGALELRMAEASKQRGGWRVNILPDKLTTKLKQEVGLPTRETVYAGHYVARKLLDKVNPERARALKIPGVTAGTKGRNLLLFVHGFNNDMEAVLNRAHQLESLYGVEVLAFSWPANGGGIAGVASYKSDKRDAKTSIGALDRVFEYMEKTLVGFNKDALDVVRRQAQAKFPTDSEKQDRYVASVAERDCPFKVSAMFHSMGNYLYKHLLLSTSSAGTGLIFDNVVLAAADANNAEHALWVDRIRCRSRVYVTINEDDRALSVSRLKSGEDQRARLGHYPYGLDSRQGVYVNFTDVQKVGDSHAYFESQPVTNPRIKRFFLEAFNGGRAESIANLSYDAATNMYRFPKRA